MSRFDPADFLLRLVATPSVSGEEGAAADLVVALASEHGLSCDRLGNTVRVRIGASEGPRLWLLSHLDTVPVGNGWTAPAYPIAWDGDRLVGRGSNDAKVCGVSMLGAAIALAQQELPGRVEVILTAQEETTNAGMGDALEAFGSPDACVCGEPTSLEVVCAQGGLGVLKAEWRGVSCHAAHAATVKNENALLAASRDLARFPSALPVGSPHPLLGTTTVVATQLKSGERHNVVPDLAEAIFDARIAPGVTADDVRAAIAELLPHAAVTIRSKRLSAVETAPDHPVVRAALRAAGRAAPIASRTLSDMAFLPGIPAVKCGPGATARSHTPDEFVLREELLAGVEFYTKAAPAILAALLGSSASTLPGTKR